MTIAVTMLAVLSLPIASVGATDSYSSAYTVDDYYGVDYNVQAMVRNAAYSDHIYGDSFWISVDVLNAGDTAVCENYSWSRITPYPSSGTLWGNGYPFPLYQSDPVRWGWQNFYQDMYWSGSQPVRILHETASVGICGSGSQWMAAGVAMYRFPTYWQHQGT